MLILSRLQVYDDITPITANNFVQLCDERVSGNKSYVGSSFHRIVPRFMCQAGDSVYKDGSGFKNIYNQRFPDENFMVKHTVPYQLTMSNCGRPNSNGAQFLITFAPCPWLDNKHVVFGEVIHGFDVVDAIEKVGREDGHPQEKVYISNCGHV